MEVQIFGIKKSADTRKALRFFAERRVKTHFVDLQERPASPGELKRFAQRFGVAALLDRESRRFADLGLAAASLSDELKYIAPLTVAGIVLHGKRGSDESRQKIADACLDYGLERIQYSAFCGQLDASRRSELAARLAAVSG